MKKILIATLTGVSLLVSVCEAQTAPVREEIAKRQPTEPPPPPPVPPLPPTAPDASPDIVSINEAPTPPAFPPPPPLSPLPSVPPVPPAPPVPDKVELSKIQPLQDRDTVMRPVNEKGFVLTVNNVNRQPVVVVRKNGVKINKIDLKVWLNENKKYEELYGKLPPPPPPPPAPRGRDNS